MEMMKLGSISFLLILSFSLPSPAMMVLKMKGTKALVDLQGESVAIGQTISVVDGRGKEIGRMKVLNSNNGKALAQLTSGKAPEKSKAIAMKPAPAASSAATSAPAPVPAAASAKKAVPEEPRPPTYGSVLLGLASNTLSLKVGDGITTQNVDNTGNSVGIGVAAERQYWQPWFRARALVAYEQFNAIGAATINGCNNQTSKDCRTDIKYLSAGLYAKYLKDFNAFAFWGAAGVNLKVPVTKTSTALVESSLGVTSSYGLTLGVDYTLETGKFLTVSLEKQFYTKSESAEISTIFIRIGVGKTF
jgi:hypothetical protein